MKCDICKNKVETMFLKKMIGTIVKDGKGKQHPICHECQQKFPTKDMVLGQL